MSSMGDILQIMREQGGADNPTVYLLGAVEQTEPLRISAGGLTLDRDDLLMAHWLAGDWDRKWAVKSGSLSGSPQSMTVTGGELVLAPEKPFLKAGDRVLLIPEQSARPGFQRFFILAKLVEVDA